MHRWDAPYRRRGGDNTSLQPRVVNKRQRERLFGVGNAPIVIEITVGDVRGVKEHRLERGDESAGIGYVRGRSVRRARRGVILGHGGDLYVFFLAARGRAGK
jgi:hypothetical protein